MPEEITARNNTRRNSTGPQILEGPKAPLVEEIERRKKIQRIVFAIIPLLAFYQPLKAPVSCIVSTINTFFHGKKTVTLYKKEELSEAIPAFLQTLLAIAGLTFFFLRPFISTITASCSELLINILALRNSIKKQKSIAIIEDISSVALASLLLVAMFQTGFILNICSITLQITINIYYTISEISKKRYLHSSMHLGKNLALAYKKSITLREKLNSVAHSWRVC